MLGDIVMSKMICQSYCLPMTEKKFFGENADDSKNEEYCYPNEAFSKDETMEQMI